MGRVIDLFKEQYVDIVQRPRTRLETKRMRPCSVCNEAVVRHAGKHCQWVRSAPVDEAIGALLLQTAAPAAIELALAVQQEIAQRVEQAAALRARRSCSAPATGRWPPTSRASGTTTAPVRSSASGFSVCSSRT